MTKQQVLDWLETEMSQFPEKVTGNEIAASIVDRIGPILSKDRDALVKALRELISFRVNGEEKTKHDNIREATLWVALDIATHLNLTELADDIDRLIEDVERHGAFFPYYASMFARFRRKLN